MVVAQTDISQILQALYLDCLSFVKIKITLSNQEETNLVRFVSVVSFTIVIMKKTLFYLLSILLFSCGDDNNCDQVFNTPFTVEEGETYCFTDNSTIEITSISNSYCACDVQCILEGEANVEGVYTGTDGVGTNFRLHEELINDNPSWAEIALVVHSNDCEPVIEQIQIRVSPQ